MRGAMAGKLALGVAVCAMVAAAAGCSGSRPPATHGSGQPARPVPASALRCPPSAQLEAAWKSAPSSVRQSWTSGAAGFAGTGGTAGPGEATSISGFNSVSCWDSYDVAQPAGNGDGLFVFSVGSRVHLLSPAELQRFSKVVCSSTRAPSNFRNVAAGPANCQP
jgi:hypothetical protein